MTADIPIKKQNNSSSSGHYDTVLLASQEEEEVKSSSAAAIFFERNHECHTDTTRPSFQINHVRVQSIDPNAQHHLKKIPTRKRNAGEEQDCLNDNDRQKVKRQYQEPLLQEPRQDQFHNDLENHPVNYQDHDEEYCLPTIDNDIMDKSYQEERETLPVKNVEEQQNAVPDHSSPPHSSSQQDDQEDDPDWEVIARTNPASEYVPIFLAARDRRNEAEARFEMALDVAHSNLKDLIDSLCGVAADVINGRRLRLDELEVDIKHDFVDNETKRDHMSKKLVQFAANAQAQFNELMNRLVNKNNGNDFVCE